MTTDGRRRSASVPSEVRHLVAPLGALVGVVVVALISLSLLRGDLLSGWSGRGGAGGAIKTPTPSNVIVVDQRTKVPGAILYVKSGNIWMQSGQKATQLTTGGQDATPTWAPDGAAIYFIRSKVGPGAWRVNGVLRTYVLETPSLARTAPQPGAAVTSLLTGSVNRGDLYWSYFLLQPAISPDGKLAAVVSDGPAPDQGDVVLKFVDLTTFALIDPKVPQVAPLGHQDPAWSPDGRFVLYVENARDGTRGAPTIQRYDRTTKKVADLTGPGYLAPAYSPDGRFVAATKSDSFGTDVVILDATNGHELLRVTADQHSFAPVWSPAGDALAFFRIDHGVVDLFMVKLTGAPAWKAAKALQLTFAAGLDAESRPAWFIPGDQLPKPTPTASPTPGATP